MGIKRIVILNPASRSGRAAVAFRELEENLRNRLGSFEVYETQAPLDATRKVREILKGKKFDQILIAGGDGTVNEAANGYFENGKLISDRIPLGVFNLGTGGDFHKTLRQISGVYDLAVKENHFRKVDCGKITIGDHVQYFLNIASAGVAGKIMHSLKTSVFQWGSPAYFYHTLKSMILYNPERVSIRYPGPDGEWKEMSVNLLNFFACNGRFNGAGMNWAPNASLEDGLFDVVVISGVSKLQLILQSQKVYAGRVSEYPGTVQFRASRIILKCDRQITGEADGEIYSSASNGEIRYEILPGILPLIL